ncbi:hypothetical protein HELRODRAFT_173920 [Helobdella robusta]|uniref:Uncharacterized protein n=1 Tax=Helobdella robusta TaxID=6412 RepID=T1F7D8_HELRO|nr:hypothetical protein HELRODRAFT_173920 [Helobdella robusta]XP_009021764.1 hypothetical protein HELRODRAFT_184363 [Helobdella robusta]ESO00137.1 hypothetical protein HELRODRAFT_184363 [Helobdella robusta]ESO03050.1 hypothetical protein HELRODRAFT_173920 [Helobdella robusta]
MRVEFSRFTVFRVIFMFLERFKVQINIQENNLNSLIDNNLPVNSDNLYNLPANSDNRNNLLKNSNSLSENSNNSDSLIKCCCGKFCKGRTGLIMHKRSCQTSKLLYFHPVVDKESASTTATLNNAQKSPSTSTTEDAFTSTTLNSVRLPMPPSSSSGVATSSITELNKVHRSPPPLSPNEATSEFKQINSIQQPTQSSSPVEAHTAPSARLLPGIKLPRTRRDWEEANAYFHAELNSVQQFNLQIF